MITARINLEGTIENELIFSASIEKAESYSVTVNNSSTIDVPDGRRDKLDIDKNLKLVTLKISPKIPNSDPSDGRPNVKLHVFRKGITGNLLKIGITIDNPYRVKMDEEGRIIIDPNQISGAHNGGQSQAGVKDTETVAKK